MRVRRSLVSVSGAWLRTAPPATPATPAAPSTSPTFFSLITTDRGDVACLCDAAADPFAAESALYYCSARYYDPATPQWTTGDPAKADGEESAHQYLMP